MAFLLLRDMFIRNLQKVEFYSENNRKRSINTGNILLIKSKFISNFKKIYITKTEMSTILKTLIQKQAPVINAIRRHSTSDEVPRVLITGKYIIECIIA